jgi:hypothetical protein
MPEDGSASSGVFALRAAFSPSASLFVLTIYAILRLSSRQNDFYTNRYSL